MHSFLLKDLRLCQFGRPVNTGNMSSIRIRTVTDSESEVRKRIKIEE